MIPTVLQPLPNHLWQSTLFAAVAGILTLALRKNRAQIRYCLWLACSVKFLIPFSILVDAGSRFGWESARPIVQPGLSSAIEQASRPFAATAPTLASPALPVLSTAWISDSLLVVWAMGFVVLASWWYLRWRRLRDTLRAASPLELPLDMDVRTSPAFTEPVLCGVLRPVLLLPAGLAEHLTQPQLEAILAHERCHMRRRDNLAAAVHMTVEALFWFHPLVWWLGARLLEERERACDEEVLRAGCEPQAYAEGILKICELYLEASLPCVARVTGANLKQRIEAIMANRIVLRMNFATKAILATVAVAALLVPVGIGVVKGSVKKQHLDAGDKYFTEGRYPEAKAQYEDAIKLDPNYGLAHYKLGVLYLKKKPAEVKNALNEYLRAEKLLKDNRSYRREYEQTIIKLSELHLVYDFRSDAALAKIEGNIQELFHRDPNSFDGIRLQGDLAFARAARTAETDPSTADKLFANALESYRKADAVKPNDSGVSMQMGIILRHQRQYASAEPYFRKVVDNDKTSYMGIVNLYHLYKTEKKTDEAETFLKEAILDNPKISRDLEELRTRN